MKEQVREEPKIVAAAERQMHAWAMSAEIQDRQAVRQSETGSAKPEVSYIAISREAGTGGSEIAQALGLRLGWEVFDHSLLSYVAERFRFCRRMLDLVDETPSNWVYDVLGTWMDQSIVPHERYALCLARVISAVARRGPAVFVGRGAQFFLPRERTLAVRLIASLPYRIRQMMERTGLGEKAARRRVAEIDNGRREFVQRYFRRDIADPSHYDLVLDVERLGRDGAVEDILAALHRRPAAELATV